MRTQTLSKGNKMDGGIRENDISRIVDLDRAHIWHHLIQHKPFETGEPRIIVEGKGMKVWDQNGKEHIDGVSGGVWTVNVGYGRESIANAVRDQLVKLNFFRGRGGIYTRRYFCRKAYRQNARNEPGLLL
jgi:taurine-pyruvate aminotransferase